MNALFRKNLQELEITPAQYALMYYLREEPGCSPTGLAEDCGLDASTITGLLTRLEKKELVERRHSEDDRRGVEVYLTAQGKKLWEPICRVIEKSNAQILSKLTRKEQEALSHCLARLCASALDP